MKKLFLMVLLAAPAWAFDLNTASVDQIAALKGVSRQTAEAIVAARPFKTSSEVLKVPGVTQGILNQNRADLTIAGKPVTTRSGTAPAIPGVRPAIPAKKSALSPSHHHAVTHHHASHSAKTGVVVNQKQQPSSSHSVAHSGNNGGQSSSHGGGGSSHGGGSSSHGGGK